MKRLLLSITILLTLSATAQIKKVSRADYNTWSKEVFYVLKSDKNIREGEYQKSSASGSHSELLVVGHYHNNQRDSVWKFYSGGNLVAQGSYKNDEKVGDWIGYTRGFERLKYDFNKDAIVSYINNPGDSAQTSVIITEANPGVVLDRLPIYVNGIASLFRNISNSVKYPAQAREAHKQGEVIIAFNIDEKGNAKDYVAKTKLGYGLEPAALNAVKNVLGEWVPALISGKPTSVQCELSFLFAIGFETPLNTKNSQIIIQAAGVPTIHSF